MERIRRYRIPLIVKILTRPWLLYLTLLIITLAVIIPIAILFWDEISTGFRFIARLAIFARVLIILSAAAAAALISYIIYKRFSKD
ncbi:MAG: hypothetical protein RQ885_14975 [Desulfurococcales archaeon]|nr:hypothetical protein [Desulfurococcales archaeon]